MIMNLKKIELEKLEHRELIDAYKELEEENKKLLSDYENACEKENANGKFMVILTEKIDELEKERKEYFSLINSLVTTFILENN